MQNRFALTESEKFFLEEALLITAEKYERLRQQRINATKKWNNAHREKVNEYNKNYQRKIYAKKKEERPKVEKTKNLSDPEQYKKYQAEYRATAKLRKLPFFNSDIIF
jgi:hypothetical protein